MSQTIIITGASDGIGAAAARQLSAKGTRDCRRVVHLTEAGGFALTALPVALIKTIVRSARCTADEPACTPTLQTDPPILHFGIRLTVSGHDWRFTMATPFTPDFSVDVQGVKGLCPAGEAYAKQQLAAKTIPVLTCEGPCIRGEIARLAGNLLAQDVPALARCCHAEAFFVPHSTMTSWVKNAQKVVMIDGCFLKCHGRILKNLVPEDRVIHIDALPLYNKFTNVFLMDDVPEEERKAVARQVANKIITTLDTELAGAAS